MTKTDKMQKHANKITIRLTVTVDRGHRQQSADDRVVTIAFPPDRTPPSAELIADGLLAQLERKSSPAKAVKEMI